MALEKCSKGCPACARPHTCGCDKCRELARRDARLPITLILDTIKYREQELVA